MPAAQTSTITDPGEFVTRFIENIEQFHFSDAMAMVADDCEYDNVPIRKEFGRYAVRKTLAPFCDRFDEIDWRVNFQAASGTTDDGVVMNERVDRSEEHTSELQSH